MTCSICIATYKRPELLAKLLNSLFEQTLQEVVNLEVIIVDNDVDETAKSICNSFSESDNIKLYYLTQPVQNISLTRNKAVRQATGEYLLFIDDDEYACNIWISELLKCLKNYNADAVFGLVIPYFEESIPDWIQDSNFFDKKLTKTGKPPEILSTSNCVIKSNLIKQFDEPFNPRLGLTGGEDGMLFRTLFNQGAKFVFCAEAIVYDFIPVERGNLKYLIQRAFRTGITHTRAVIYFSKNKYIQRIYSLIKGMLYAITSIFLTLFCSPSKILRCYWYIKIFSNLGHIAGVFNFKYKMYKE